MSGLRSGGSPTQYQQPMQQQNQSHSLAFRVMRLCRPSLQSQDAVLRLDPLDLLAPEDLFNDPSLSPDLFHRRLLSDDPLGDSPAGAGTAAGDFSFRDRFQIRNPIDAMALSGLLVLPQSFGSIYLGETFCSYISINNSSSFEARDVIIKAEVQTERQRILLLDSSKSPIESIRAGGRYDFIVEHDVKELGPHTLMCTALYTDGDGERKYLPQFFKFAVSNPLSVRTKVRTVKNNTFLEACLENHTKTNLYMDQVEFESTQQWIATRLEPDEHPSLVAFRMREIFKPPILIKSGGGIYNYLYQLKPSSGDGKIDGGSILGKFQITWRTNLGEPGRLQTAQIHTTPIAHKDAELRVLDVPSAIHLNRPFLIQLCLTNQTDRTLGPFEVLMTPAITGEEKVVVVNGLQKLVLSQVEAFGSLHFNLVSQSYEDFMDKLCEIFASAFEPSVNLIATKMGIQKISGVMIFNLGEKKLYDPVPDVEGTRKHFLSNDVVKNYYLAGCSESSMPPELLCFDYEIRLYMNKKVEEKYNKKFPGS